MEVTLFKKQEVDLEELESLYKMIFDYANDRYLPNVVKLLPITRDLLIGEASKHLMHHFYYCLRTCEMLIELKMPVTEREMDHLIAAALGDMLCQTVEFPMHGEELSLIYGVDGDVCKIIRLLYNNSKNEKMTEEAYYSRIQKHKPALIVKICTTAIMMEQLFTLPLEQVNEHLRSIRLYFFPMCIFAKEYYSELELVVSVLMEKVRLLLEVNDILSNRYQQREIALIHEMLVLQEENARIRVSIRALEEE